MTKREHELEIFREFIELSGLEVDRKSVRSENPPHPDISCVIGGRRHFFELTRLADQSIADDVGALLARARRTGEGGTGTGHWYSNRGILRTAFERKDAETYQTDGYPVSLLMYCDGVFHAVGALELFRPAFLEIKEEHRSKWHEVWLYDRNQKLILK